MKKILPLLVTLVFVCSMLSQRIPSVKVGDSLKLKLSDLKVDIIIAGNTAVTTYDMSFFNETNSTLEGELSFPLEEGQSVSRFAMEINGSLREAVVVEKELGRIAFESTVRQNIDPALLTKTQGNNYKTRVYPLLPNKLKRVIVSYEEELGFNEKYVLPLVLSDTLENFSISVKAIAQKEKPIIKGYNNLRFIESNRDYTVEKKWKKYLPNNILSIELPKKENEVNAAIHKEYFNISGYISSNLKSKKKPNRIQLLWDISYSMSFRNKEMEFQLLDKYFKYLNKVDVDLILFNVKNKGKLNFKIINGDWKELKQKLNSAVYDGATSYKVLSSKFNCDEILLFSDGLVNFSANQDKLKIPVYTISSKTSANYSLLKKIAQNSGGNYLNLIKKDLNKAMNQLNSQNYKFLGIKRNKNISEIYPKKHTNISGTFSVSGKFKQDTTIELLFGYANEVEDSFKVVVNKSSNKTPLIRRLWAKQKLEYLSDSKEENKDEIIALGKGYKLISDYTSMIILDRVEDYVKYKIEPPTELRKEYKEILKNQKENNTDLEEELIDLREDLKETYKDVKEWYDKDWDSILKAKIREEKRENILTIKRKKDSILRVKRIKDSILKVKNELELKKAQDSISLVNQKIELKKRQDSLINSIKINQNNNRGGVTVTGVVSSNEFPLPGVNITVKGKTTGTITDFDGLYAINIEQGDILEFSSIGFMTNEVRVNSNSIIDVVLEEDVKSLEEVVVVGYGTSKRSSLSGSVTAVKIDEISNVRIRGISSLQGLAAPLYVVDGVLTSDYRDLPKDEIDSVSVIKDASAAAIYGSRGANGVIVITTKSGKKENAKAISVLQEKIEDKITLQPRDSDLLFIKQLEKFNSDIDAYDEYIKLRNEYLNIPTFYLDVSDFFNKRNNKELALLVLSNLIEIDLDNYELMRALAYKLEYFDSYDLALEVYRKILELRPEDPQSYRDLALAYQEEGQYQKSFDLLYKIYDGTIMLKDDDFKYEGMEGICYVELLNLITNHKKEIKLNKVQKKDFHKITEIETDVRITIDWNHNETDIDLWVIDPNGEKCNYKNDNTKIGGRLSEDLTEGFGPEEFMLKKAIKGDYKVILDYYDDSSQKISGPTIVKVIIFFNYGKSNQEKRVLTIQSDEDKELEVAKFKI